MNDAMIDGFEKSIDGLKRRQRSLATALKLPDLPIVSLETWNGLDIYVNGNKDKVIQMLVEDGWEVRIDQYVTLLCKNGEQDIFLWEKKDKNEV